MHPIFINYINSFNIINPKLHLYIKPEMHHISILH